MLTSLANMVAADELDLLSLWSIMEQAEILPPDFDAQAVEAKIKAEVAARVVYPVLPARSALKPGATPPEPAPPTVQ